MDDERVHAQDGDFYGGWITSDLVGPFKGAAGTLGWSPPLAAARQPDRRERVGGRVGELARAQLREDRAELVALPGAHATALAQELDPAGAVVGVEAPEVPAGEQRGPADRQQPEQRHGLQESEHCRGATRGRSASAVRDAVVEADRRRAPAPALTIRLRSVRRQALEAEARHLARELDAAEQQVELELRHPRPRDPVRLRARPARDLQLEDAERLRPSGLEGVAEIACLAAPGRGCVGERG